MKRHKDSLGINVDEALASLELVRNLKIEEDIAIKVEEDSRESREKVYGRYEMKSLYKD